MAGQSQRDDLAHRRARSRSTAIEAAAIANRIPSDTGSSTQRAITAREKWPCPTNSTSRVAMCSSANATAPSARSLTCCDALTALGAVRPDQPVRHGLSDLRRRQALVVAVIPFLQKGRHLVDGQPGQFGGDCSARRRGLLITNGLSSSSIGERFGGQLGLLPAHVGQLEIGAAGVLTRLRDHSVSPCRSSNSRCCRTLTLTDSAARRVTVVVRVPG